MKRNQLVAALAALAIAGTGAVQAQTWQVDSAGTFSNAANWLGNVAPATSGANLVFTNIALTGTRTVTADAAWSTTGSVNSITLNSNSGSNGVNIAGSGITSFTIGAGGITNSSVGRTLSLAATLPTTLGASQVWTNSTSCTITVYSVLSGGALNQLTLSGSSFNLFGNNTYAGGTVIQTNTSVAVGHNNALGTGAVTINGSGATLRNASAGQDYTISNNFTVGANFNMGTTGANVGTIRLGGTVDLGAAATRQISVAYSASGTNTAIIEGVISGSSALSATASADIALGTSPSVLRLTGDNTYSGRTSVTRATLEFDSITNVNGGASALGSVTTVSDGTINIGNALNTGSTLRYIGTGNSVTDRVVNFNQQTTDATIQNNGTGTIEFTSASTSTTAGSKTVYFGGSNTGQNKFVSVANPTTGAVSVVKQDAGTWVFTGSSTYNGTTTVSAGTLLIDGSLAAGSAVTVNGGTLGGTGTIGGDTVLNAGAKLSAGNNSATTLDFTNALNLSGAANDTGAFVFTLGTAYDQVIVGGTLTLGTNLLGSADFAFSNGGGLAESQTYTLFDATALSGTFTTFAVTNIGGSGINGNVSILGQDIILTTVPEPATWALLAGSLTTVIVLRRRRRP